MLKMILAISSSIGYFYKRHKYGLYEWKKDDGKQARLVEVSSKDKLMAFSRRDKLLGILDD